MSTTRIVRCPDCGCEAKQSYNLSTQRNCPGGLTSQLECLACDYLMVTCAANGKVIEAYTSGLSTSSLPVRPTSLHHSPRHRPLPRQPIKSVPVPRLISTR